MSTQDISPVTVDRDIAANQPVLRFDSVSLSFDEQPALRDVSFQLLPGQTCILFGAAGSGKSVLLKAAIGLLRPDRGEIGLFGQNITRMD